MRDRTLPLAEVGSSASASDLRSSAGAGAFNGAILQQPHPNNPVCEIGLCPRRC